MRLHTDEGKRAHAVRHARATVKFRTEDHSDGYRIVRCTTCGEQDRWKIDTAPRNVAEGEA